MTDVTELKASEAGSMAPAVTSSRHVWTAIAVMEGLFGVLFVASLYLVFFLVRTGPALSVPWSSSDWARDVFFIYLVVAIVAHFIIAVVLIPVSARTLGRELSQRTRTWSPVASAFVFGAVAALPGLIVAAPLFTDDGIGWLIALNFALVPALAAFGTRLLLPVTLRVKAARVTAIVLAAVVVAYSLWMFARLVAAVIEHQA